MKEDFEFSGGFPNLSIFVSSYFGFPCPDLSFKPLHVRFDGELRFFRIFGRILSAMAVAQPRAPACERGLPAWSPARLL